MRPEETDTKQELTPQQQLVIDALDDMELVEAIFSHPNVQARLATLATNIAAHVDKTMRNIPLS